MVKIIKEYLYLFVLLVLQTTFFTRIKIFGVIPNLVLVFSVCFFSVNKVPHSAFFGVVAGLMLDWIVGDKTGLNAIIFLYLGVFVSFVSNRFFYKRLVYIFILTFLISAVYNALFLTLNFYIWGKYINLKSFIKVFLQCVSDAIFSIAGYFLYVKTKKALNSALSFKKEVIF
ncbi:MAG: rod shape-determining protein MreD [Ruminococcaceae bacterium]|nr:rod shape-determining protein MreD [Oscillospiraceae bacterium]